MPASKPIAADVASFPVVVLGVLGLIAAAGVAGLVLRGLAVMP